MYISLSWIYSAITSRYVSDGEFYFFHRRYINVSHFTMCFYWYLYMDPKNGNVFWNFCVNSLRIYDRISLIFDLITKALCIREMSKWNRVSDHRDREILNLWETSKAQIQTDSVWYFMFTIRFTACSFATLYLMLIIIDVLFLLVETIFNTGRVLNA